MNKDVTFFYILYDPGMFLIWRERFEPPEQKNKLNLGHILMHNCVRDGSDWSWSNSLALLILRQCPVLWIHRAKLLLGNTPKVNVRFLNDMP